MSRNYGTGTRSIGSAVTIIVNRAVFRKEISFSTAATLADRFSKFIEFLKTHGVGRLERVSPELLIEYGQLLAMRVDDEECSSAYAQNLVSAVNSVMKMLTAWESVSPTRECGIPERCSVRKAIPASVDLGLVDNAVGHLLSKNDCIGVIIVLMARFFGLRSKEASLFDARTGMVEVNHSPALIIHRGTKGGRKRVIPLHNISKQSELLNLARDIQSDRRAIIPQDVNWISWRNNQLRSVRDILINTTGEGLHDLRAAYACDRYLELTGQLAPVFGANSVEPSLDRSARLKIASELGHNRSSIASAYIGGRK